MKFRHVLVVASVAALIGALTGCDSAPRAVGSAAQPTAQGSVSAVLPSAAPTAPTAPSGDLLRGRVLPLFAYQETPEQSAATVRAVAALKNQCLARFGFPPLPVSATVPTTPPMYRVFGVTDPAVAARYGYHLDPVGLAVDPTSAPPPPTYSSSMQLVMLGYAPGGEVPDPDNPAPRPTQTYQGKVVPPFGCQGEAARALDPVGVTGDELNLAQGLGAAAFVRARDGGVMKAATARWAACMKAKGYGGRYDSPFGASDKFSAAGPLTRTEIATAVADVACKGQTHLVDTWFAVDKDFENAAIQKNIETLTKVKTARDAALAKALAVVSNGGG